jgi:hypothetical protein
MPAWDSALVRHGSPGVMGPLASGSPVGPLGSDPAKPMSRVLRLKRTNASHNALYSIATERAGVKRRMGVGAPASSG